MEVWKLKMAVVLLAVVTCVTGFRTTGAPEIIVTPPPPGEFIRDGSHLPILQNLRQLQHQVSFLTTVYKMMSPDVTRFVRNMFQKIDSMIGSFANRSQELEGEIRSLYYREKGNRDRDVHLLARKLRGIRRKIDRNVENLQSQIDSVTHPDVMTSCGGSVSSHIRTIRYPRTGTYSNTTNCTWIIHRTQPFILRFSRFDVERDWQCGYDYVRIGNNHSKKLCGNRIPPPTHFSPRDGFLTLFFHSDGSVAKTGFEAHIVPVHGLRNTTAPPVSTTPHGTTGT